MTSMVATGNQRLHGTGLVLRDPIPWDRSLEIVRTAEETGYAAVFVPEIRAREAFTTLAGFAAATSTIRLGTGVVTVRARDPVTTAMATATLQEVSGGRAVLGLGSGTSGVLRTMGGGPGPIDLVRRFVRTIAALLAGDEAGDGSLGWAPTALEAPPLEPTPIWLGALGDRMIALAGEVADGVLLNWCTPQRVREAGSILRRAAEGARRDPDEPTIAVYVRACLAVDERVALDALREATGRYVALPRYLAQLRRMGLGEPAARASAAAGRGRFDEVPEDLVRTLTVAGGRDAWVRRADAYREAGADLVLCYPVLAVEPITSALGTVLAAAPSPALER